MNVVFQAPHIVAPLVLAIATAVWWFRGHLFSGRIASLEDRIKLKDDQLADYKNKLSGATPDEAKARLDALEQQVRTLSPRRLSDRQRRTISDLIGVVGPGRIMISQDMGCSDARTYSLDFKAAFEAAGWIVDLSQFMGNRRSSPHGLGFIVHDMNRLDAKQSAIRRALLAASIEFDLAQGNIWPSQLEAPFVDAMLEFTTKEHSLT